MGILACLALWNGVLAALGLSGWVLHRGTFSLGWFLVAAAMFNLNVLLILDRCFRGRNEYPEGTIGFRRPWLRRDVYTDPRALLERGWFGRVDRSPHFRGCVWRDPDLAAAMHGEHCCSNCLAQCHQYGLETYLILADGRDSC